MPFCRRCLSPLVALLMTVVRPAVAQDTRFSLAHATGLQLNPALAGTAAVRSVTFTARDQYPALGEGFLTGALSADWRIHKLRGAVAISIMYDRAGAAPLNRLQATLGYAYHTRLTENWSASAALSGGYGQQRGNLGKYVFGDQLLLDGSTGTTAENLAYLPVSYLSIGTGAVVYNKVAWLGGALHHANTPRLSGGSGNGQLDPRVVIHGGYKIYLLSALNLNRFYEFSVTPVATFQWQGAARGLDLGFYTTYSPLTLGLVYRNPLLLTPTASQHWLVASLTLAGRGWRLGYAYDLGFGTQTRGAAAHELAFRLEELDFSGLLKKRTTRRLQPFIAAPAL